MKEVFLLAACVAAALAAPHIPKDGVCGLESCPKPVPGKLNVHLVAHTHDDVGWGSTIDQYYYHSVQYILDTVTNELIKDPSKRFIYVELAFFWKWWLQQTPEYQDKVKTLVANGQLEFINGAWSMNDEASVHYQSTIDQFTHGLRKLNDTFGVCGQPRVGWQIDPFGHGRETANLMAQFYFDGLFFARLDHNDKAKRLNDKTMEMIWQGNPALGEKAELFTNVLYNHYSTPNGFCWDLGCTYNEQLVDDPESPIYNLKTKVDLFLMFCNEQAQYYTTDNIIVLFGDDFHYAAAHNNFKNVDKLMKNVNARQAEGSNINVFYSTPSCYLKAVNDANQTYTTKQDDFFPYGSDPHVYWTGYFTTRPSLKFFERVGNRVLQAIKQLDVVTNVDAEDALEELKGAMGVLQHHDGISGTELQWVAEDYSRILAKAITATEPKIAQALNLINKQNPSAADLGLQHCRFLNVSQCALTAEKNSFLTTVYNTLSKPVDRYIRLPVQNVSYTVQDDTGAFLTSQLVPIPDTVVNAPGRNATTNVELVFLAKAIPAVGFASYYVTKVGDTPPNYSKVTVPAAGADITVGYSTKSVTFDGQTKLIKSILSGNQVSELKQTIQYYIGFPGDNSDYDHRGSGAYAFRPLGVDTHEIAANTEITVVEGPVLTEVHQKFSDWASQVIRIYPMPYSIEDVEIEYLVGPIPVEDGDGKEVVLRYETNLKSNKVFYTDNNGRGSMERIRDYRATWDLEVDEPVAGNYYPVNGHIAVQEGSKFVAVVNDRAQGGSSMKDGAVELMVHRRLRYTDGITFEAPNEEQFGVGLVIRGHHEIVLGASQSDQARVRQKEILRTFAPTILLSDVTGRSFDQISKDYVLKYTAVNAQSVPDDIILLTLEQWREGQLLVRLENVYGADYGKSATVDLTKVLVNFQINGARETGLAAHKYTDEWERLKWRKQGQTQPEKKESKAAPVDVTNITVNPEDIRTFIVDVTKKL